MSATLLLRAAGRIRQTAQAATTGPWWAYPIAGEAEVEVEVEVYSGTGSSEDLAVADGAYRADAEHIATWSPDVALLVADVLTMAAIRHADLTTAGGPDDRDFALTPAQADDVLRTELTLARRILGDDQ